MNSIIVTYNREKPTVSKLSRCPLLHSWTSGTAPDHQRTSGKPSLSPLLLLLQLGPFRVSSARSSPKSSRMVQTNQLTATGMRTNAVFGAHQWASWFRLFQKKTLNSIQIFNIKRVERLRWLWVPSLVKQEKKRIRHRTSHKASRQWRRWRRRRQEDSGIEKSIERGWKKGTLKETKTRRVHRSFRHADYGWLYFIKTFQFWWKYFFSLGWQGTVRQSKDFMIFFYC